jgi:uncharacterized membrane protein YfcA
MWLLAIPLGLAIGLALGAFGGGGSILTVPALVYVLGVGAKSAVTTSLLIVAITAVAGMVAHLHGGRVRVSAGVVLGLTGIAGSLAGSRLNEAVAPRVLLIAFSGLMVLAAWRMWVSGSTKRCSDVRIGTAHEDADDANNTGNDATNAGDADRPSTKPSPVAQPRSTLGRATPTTGLRLVAGMVAVGTLVGFMTGFFGVGGGFVVVPALVLVLRYDMAHAVGTSLLVIAINSATALVSRVSTATIDWKVALPFTLASVAGALAGDRLTERSRPCKLVQGFAVLLVAVAAYTLVHSLVAG